MPSVKQKNQRPKKIKSETKTDGLTVAVYNQTGKEVGTIDLPTGIFGLKPKMSLIKQAMEAQLANSRVIRAKVKDRGEVRGGGKKPWRQKGTGRARHGSIRSPIWRGGGVTFGPTTEKKYAKKINKKMKRQALLMVLSGKARDNELVVLDKINLPEIKTKQMDKILNNLTTVKNDLRKGALLILGKKEKEIARAARNIQRIETIAVDSLNIMDLLNKKYLMMIRENIREIEEMYSPK